MNIVKDKQFIYGTILALVVLGVIAYVNLSEEQETSEFISNFEAEEKVNVEDDKSTPENEEVLNKMNQFEQSVSTVRELTPSQKEEIKDFNFKFSASLEDVTDGKTVDGLNTGGEATGLARSLFRNNIFYLYVDFENLPESPEGFFYEGWVVRQEPFRFESTGRLEKVDGRFEQVFVSEKDLLDHDFYVLTLEKESAGPEPEDHILEGELE